MSEEELTEQVVRQQAGQFVSFSPDEVAVMQRAYLLLYDEDVKELVKRKYPELIPVFNALNRTSYIDAKTARKLRIKLQLILSLKLINMKESEFNLNGLAEMKALEIFGECLINDAIQGRRIKAIVEETKHLTVRTEKPQKKSWWRRILP